MSPRPFPSLVFVFLMVMGWSAGPVLAHELDLSPSIVITTAQDIRNLAPEEAKSARTVKLSGVITHINPHLNDFFLQDNSAGIYVHPTDLAKGLSLGDRIELEGVTDPGDFAPCVHANKITHLGQGKLPEPTPYTLITEESRWRDAQWVQVSVVVRGVRTGPNITRLDVYNAFGAGAVIIPGEHWASEARKLKNKSVIVRGVCVPTFANRMLSGPPSIYSTGLPQISVIPDEPDSGLDAPPRLISSLLGFRPSQNLAGQRLKVAGVVIATPFPGVLIIQDDTLGATIWTSPTRTDIPVGMRIEALGFIHVDGHRISVDKSTVKKLGEAPLPQPESITGTEMVQGVRETRLVCLEARLEAVRELKGWTALTLVDGAARFEVFAPGTPEQNQLTRIRPGSRVKVTGAPFDMTPDGKAASRTLFLPSVQSLTLLDPPPSSLLPPSELSWWSTTRVAYLCGGFLAVTLLGGGWLFVLRHQVQRAAGVVKQQYEEKARLEDQLRQAAKLEAVGRLAGGIAHDFNNLLTVINGCAEILEDETGKEGGNINQLASEIREAGERAAALTGQLLTFSRKREVPITAVNINDIVTESVRLLDRVIGENIRIRTDLSPNLPRIHGETTLLNQVVMNLALNARDAMPGGGTLGLATTRVSEPVAASETSVPLRQFVRLTVTDTGLGMSDEVRSRIFEPFFTTKEVGKGTGLGLATVYGIIQTLRGKIHVDSKVGQGTTFHIDLRLHEEPLSDSDPALPKKKLPLVSRRGLNSDKLKGMTILVVEDNAMVRNLMVSGLTAEGAKVLSAEDSSQALSMLANHPNVLDVLVTDVVMPGMSGRMLAEKVRVERPAVQVVFMSGYTADVVLREGVLEDQVEFLQKPFTPEHLTNRLVGVLERRTQNA